MTELTSESQAEAKVIKDLLYTVVVLSYRLDELLKKYSLKKVVRIGGSRVSQGINVLTRTKE